jgi:hypothetical protein
MLRCAAVQQLMLGVLVHHTEHNISMGKHGSWTCCVHARNSAISRCVAVWARGGGAPLGCVHARELFFFVYRLLLAIARLLPATGVL